MENFYTILYKHSNILPLLRISDKFINDYPCSPHDPLPTALFTLQLNDKYDKDDRHHILRLIDTFIHRRHLCLVFELLSVNLYELIKQNQFRGLSTNLVRVFTAQLLDALTVLNEANIIHCDLKPENVLLKK